MFEYLIISISISIRTDPRSFGSVHSKLPTVLTKIKVSCLGGIGPELEVWHIIYFWMGKWAYGTPEKKMSVLFSESLVLISEKEIVRVCGVCEDKQER